ncbi:MAG: nicotinate-nucleotide--dimethylbenzimidazole phosphoribosyltransferase [bacterium]|nr:nicotinate-nucleotide--dimethylbenzimidazole phosphoribosyltransferase [bacterium]
MIDFKIKQVSQDLRDSILNAINQKTKPVGSLGKLEDIALQIGLIQGSINPELIKPSIVVFAGDHGVAAEGVSAYPAEVTPQMVLNFVSGGAAINVFTKQHGIDLHVVDAGVNYTFESDEVIDCKVGFGTKSYLYEQAMTKIELNECFAYGIKVADRIIDSGSNIIGFGEMGIGNTSSAALIMSEVCFLPLQECVGKGTGLDSEGLNRKLEALRDAKKTHPNLVTPEDILCAFSGFEIAQMTAAMLRTADRGAVILVDGFISTSAFLLAAQIDPNIIDYAIFSHCSDESGHGKMLDYLQVKPVLDLQLRLGEGTGCALAYPIIESAVRFLNEMASFESADVSEAI